jgi:UPF0755 protein
MMSLFSILFFIVSVLLVAAALGNFVYHSVHILVPEDVNVTISDGSPLRRISVDLAASGVIRDAIVFELYVRFLQKSGEKVSLKSGEYEFKKGQDFYSVVAQMIAGKVKDYSFTIPEGFNLKQIATVMVKDKKLMTGTEFSDQVSRADLIARLNQEFGVTGMTTLEGFLFPDTYTYTKKSTPKQIMDEMVDTFIKRWKAEFGAAGVAELDKHQISFLQMVTLASLVEKETGDVTERPLIAGVFYLRLEKGMLLQTDPAVIYGIKDFNGNLTSADLKRDTPYNTYTRAGIPPGPICSVGLAALRAVLAPQQTEALYFVAKGNGSHYFSKTLEQHNQAVRYYQLKQGPPPP